MDPEKDKEAEAHHPVGGAHGLRGGSSSEQGTMAAAAEKEDGRQRQRDTFASSDELEKGDKKMEERKSSFDDVDEATDGEPYQEDIIERSQTTHTHASARSRLSRIASLATSSSRRKNQQQLPPTIHPVSDLDAGVVGWDSQDDPAMPMNFDPRRKWIIIWFLAGITFMTPFASSILAPAIEYFNADFGNDDLTLGTLPVSIYLLGYAVGPLFLAPLSEIYGRRPVLSAANLFFCAWLIGCALAPTLNSLIVFRFFAGVGGSGCLAIGGGVIADMIPVQQRGKALTIWMVGPLIGPTLAPLVGAFIAQDIGWRWSSWIALIAATPMALVIAVFNQETNPRVLIDRKVSRLRKELNRPELRSVYLDPSTTPTSTSQVLIKGLIRPLKMLFLSPIIFSVSLYIAFAYGVLYLLFSTIPLVFHNTYGFSIGTTGLVYIPLGLGYIIGMACFTILSDNTVVRMTKANNGVFEPEMRLPDCIYFAFLLPVTFFWYGWTAEFHTHWAAPVVGLLPFGIAILGIWQPIQAYIIDAYPGFAASGLAAFTVFRSIVAAFLPMAGPSMYDALGLGWGNSLLGFIAVALIPVPALIYRYGGRLRKWQKLEL
ncbi:major facilitator superfamily transporter [Colletotrichum karsti]|uniref:Major facilitator superfamily transporter n=1 Tax=Colletotrichum karsti TaxID=1095194 RepID=A0A9P6HS23_9PEZI|nr:major facilitator superfamily transporter [Colletotrichum karsti]KAF9869547.1 major facilitator superfamily transporter [Colletotrichum karsti]